MTLDELCGPGLSYGIFIPGCTFGDSIDADDADAEVVIFLVDDFDFNDDFNHDNDFNFDDNSRSGNFVG